MRMRNENRSGYGGFRCQSGGKRIVTILPRRKRIGYDREGIATDSVRGGEISQEHSIMMKRCCQSAYRLRSREKEASYVG